MIQAPGSIPANSTNLLNRIGSSVADSKIYTLAKSLFTKIGGFFSSCMSFCKERFNAFKEKVSPSHQQPNQRVRQRALEDDDSIELLLLDRSNATSAPPSLALVPYTANRTNATQSQASVPENEKKSSEPLLLQLKAPHLGFVPHNIVVAYFPQLALNGSDAPSDPQSLDLVPYVDLEKHISRTFINESREERTNLQSLRQAGAALALRGMGPRAEQFAQFKKYLAQNPIQAFQFPIQALQFQRDGLANRG